MADNEMSSIWPQLDERRKQAVHDLEDATKRLDELRIALRTLHEVGVYVPDSYAPLAGLMAESADESAMDLLLEQMGEVREVLAQAAEPAPQMLEEVPKPVEAVPEPEEPNLSQLASLRLQPALMVVLAHENRPMTADEAAEYLATETGKSVNRGSVAASLNTLVSKRPEIARVDRGVYQYVGQGSVLAGAVALERPRRAVRSPIINSTVESPAEMVTEILSESIGQWFGSDVIFERMHDRGYHPSTGRPALRQLLSRQFELGNVEKRVDPRNKNQVQYRLRRV